MKKSVILLFLSLHVLNIKVAVAQTFEKKIDSTFQGYLGFCTEISNEYYFIGREKINNQHKLSLFKTNQNGNIIIRNNNLSISSNPIIYSNIFINAEVDYNHNILLSDSNKLIKINTNFEVLWIKSISNVGYIKSIKSNQSGKYVINTSSNNILFLDTSGTIISTNINYEFFLRDFDLLNDTLFTLFSTLSSGSSNLILLRKYDLNGKIIFEKYLNNYVGYYPRLLVVNKLKNTCTIFSELSYHSPTTLSSIILDDSFNVQSNYFLRLHNLWVTKYRYNNNSFLICGDYDSKGNPDCKNLQMDDTLQLKASTLSNSIFQDVYQTDDGYLLSVDELGYIYKRKSTVLTSIETTKINDNLQFYPNPFAEKSTVKFEYADHIIIEVYDSQGKKLFINKYFHSDQIEINDSDLPNAGIYFYKIQADGKYYSGKLIKN